MAEPLAISGYVLAGGRSSRMGRDKALLELGGKPLVQLGVEKLQRICAEVAILSNNEELVTFGPVVKDLHPDCGPMSGIEAALSHSSKSWSMILPVDVPFLPGEFLRRWAEETIASACRVSLFEAQGVPQPTILLIRRELRAALSAAIGQGRYKLFPQLQAAGRAWGGVNGIQVIAAADEGYFVNLNTPVEFALAEQRLTQGSDPEYLHLS